MAFLRNPNFQQMPNGKLPTNTFLERRHFTTAAFSAANYRSRSVSRPGFLRRHSSMSLLICSERESFGGGPAGAAASLNSLFGSGPPPEGGASRGSTERVGGAIGTSRATSAFGINASCDRSGCLVLGATGTPGSTSLSRINVGVGCNFGWGTFGGRISCSRMRTAFARANEMSFSRCCDVNARRRARSPAAL